MTSDCFCLSGFLFFLFLVFFLIFILNDLTLSSAREGKRRDGG